MKNYRKFTLLILSFCLFLSVADAQTRRKKTIKKSKTTRPVVIPAPPPPIDKSALGYKVLVEGFQSKVETPFIFVAYDAETYALIRSLAEGLPESSTIDFSQTAVVAAFAGTRNTGGFSVKIQPSAGKTSVKLVTPPKGAMTAQMITYPFQIASVPLAADQTLNLELGTEWTSQIQDYQVLKGEFEYAGGFAGQNKKFNFRGTIGVLTFGDHKTFVFNLNGKGADSNRQLFDTVSGFVRNSMLEIARLEPKNFAEFPHPPVKVTGTITDKKMMLDFESLSLTVADGYTGRGKLEAVKK